MVISRLNSLTSYRLLYWLFCLLTISLLSIQVAGAKALSQSDTSSIYSDTVWYKVGACSGDGSSATSADPKINLDNIAKKYSLQSAIVKQAGGQVLDSYNADEPPNSPVSVLKLVIADAFLSTDPNLGRQVKITADELYDGPGSGDGSDANPKAGQNITLKTALIQTLMQSSDTDANVLINESGGTKKITGIAQDLGYKSTKIGAYYSSSATEVSNETTVVDLTNAMENIFNKKTDDYRIAQNALRNDTNTFGLNSDANKWGGVPGTTTHKPATGNSALFGVHGSNYIITMYVNQPWNGNDLPSVGLIRDATNEVVSAIRSAGASGSQTDASCCNTQSGGDVYTFLQTLANKESGGDPNSQGNGAYGKYQYQDPTWHSSASSYYAPALQFSRASSAPEAVQDAVAYIEYSVKFIQFKGDIFKIAVSHFLPAANEDARLLDIVPPGNHESPRQYANNFIADLKAHKGQNQPLKYMQAPDFETQYLKHVGRPYSDQSGADQTDCSSGVAAGNFVFYNQNDPKWARHAYGSSTIAASGCGPTSVAMVVATLANNSITPTQTADFGTQNGAYIDGKGSDHQKMLIDGPEHWGLKVQSLGTSLDKAASIIRNGGLVIAAGQGGHPFSADGHILVLRALNSSGKFLIGNPAPGLQTSQDQSFSAGDLASAGLQALYGVTK